VAQQQQREARPQKARDEEQQIAQPRLSTDRLDEAIPADQHDATEHNRSAEQMVAAEPLAQEKSCADRVDDGHSRRCDHRPMRQWRKTVAAGLQQRKQDATQRGHDQTAPPADAGEIAHAEAQQYRQHDQPCHDEAREDQVHRQQAPQNAGARCGEAQRRTQRHGGARQQAEAQPFRIVHFVDRSIHHGSR
jgi:hypothetical protein